MEVVNYQLDGFRRDGNNSNNFAQPTIHSRTRTEAYRKGVE